MTALSLTLKWRDLVVMGLHVSNMFVNREASPIEATETLGKGITRPGFGPQVELQMLVLFLKIMARMTSLHRSFSKLRRTFL